MQLLHREGVNNKTIITYLKDLSAYESTQCELHSARFSILFDYDSFSGNWFFQSKPNIYACDSIGISKFEKYKGAFKHTYWKFTHSQLYPSHGSGKEWKKHNCDKSKKGYYGEFLSDIDLIANDKIINIPINCQRIMLSNYITSNKYISEVETLL